MLGPSNPTQKEQTSARVKFTVHWIQISQVEWVA